MKIEWHLDAEEPLDADNLVGDMTLMDGQHRLAEPATYLDSWIEALITGLQAVQAGRQVCIDIPEEPDALVFEPPGKGVRISYRTMMLQLDDCAELQSAVYRAAQAFLQQLADVAGWERNQVLRSIRHFVCQAQPLSAERVSEVRRQA